MMPFAAAISEHPLPATAVGEVAGHLMDKIGEGADLLCLFVTSPHAGALEDIAAAMHTLLDPKVLIGCAAEGVVGPGREVEGTPAIVAWAGNVGPVHPVRLKVVDAPAPTPRILGEDAEAAVRAPASRRAVDGWPIDLEWVPAGAVIVADPFSFPVTSLFDVLNNAGGFPRVTGGMASGAQGPGGNRIVLNDKVYDDGAVGVLIGANHDLWMQTVVASGCRPVGTPLVVTAAEGNVIRELAGEPALTRLTTMMKTELTDDEVQRASDGLLIGRVINEHAVDYGPGDFLIRTFIDADPLEGTITVGERMPVGTTVQFHLRDAETADVQLRTLLGDTQASSALLFTGNGRGTSLFEEPDHDAGIVADLLDDPPTAGFFTTGEFGPLGGKNYVNGFTASLALFSPPHDLDAPAGGMVDPAERTIDDPVED